MPLELRELEREYLAALLAFLESPNEQNLERAYGVARKAIANDLGVLDLASIFRKALGEVLPHIPAAPLTEQIVERSMNFFRESLSPFEMTLRGFRENNEKLRESCRQLTNAQMRLRYQNQELTIARQRYSEQFDFAPDGYLVTDLAGKIEEANVAASLLLGVEQDELVGDSLALYLQGDGPHVFNTQVLRLQRGVVERLADWQTTIMPETGASFPAALSAGVIRDPAGKLAGIRWLVRDISQFKRAEAERSDLLVRERVARAEAETARRLAFLADASTLLSTSLDSESTLRSVAQLATPFLADWCVVYILDDDGTLKTVAVAPQDPMRIDETLLTGHLAHWIQRSLARTQPEHASALQPFLLRPDDEAFKAIGPLGICGALAAPLAIRGKHLGAIALLSAESQRTFGETDRALLEDLAQRCSYAVDNSRLHSEVILQRDKAEKASRVKDEFLAILSHELRNPLVPILGWARVFGTRTDTSDEVFAEGVRSLERNARNIQRLVDDCLELVRTSTRRIRLELQRMDLNSIAAASIEAVVPLAREKGLKLDIALADGPLWVVGDRTRLEQVVVNLLTNAVKYTPSGTVEVRSRRAQGQAEVHVSDTGIGIAPDFIGKVFEPFRQATDAWLTSDSGLGIGLSIAREIVRLHSGWIWAESPGLRKGSTFSIALPIQADDSLPLPAEPRQATAIDLPGRRCRILLVEDSDDVLYLMKRELEWTGHKVYAAMDGMTALEIAKRELPDIIISDIKMPRLDGYEFIQQIRAAPNLASIPAIAMTGFGMERDGDQARSAGYSAHLVKPVDIAEMERLIQSLTGTTLPS